MKRKSIDYVLKEINKWYRYDPPESMIGWYDRKIDTYFILSENDHRIIERYYYSCTGQCLKLLSIGLSMNIKDIL